jgi:hypothetical protein
MGRIRRSLRWTLSFGGTGAGSPIRAESSAEQAAREQTALLREAAGRETDDRFSASDHERAQRAGRAFMAKQGDDDQEPGTTEEGRKP